MKASKFSDAQIAFVLKQAENGTSIGARKQIPLQITLIEQEIKSKPPNQNAVRAALGSIKNIVEGAGSSLVASGINTMFTKLSGSA